MTCLLISEYEGQKIPSGLEQGEFKDIQEQNIGQKLRHDFRSSGISFFENSDGLVVWKSSEAVLQSASSKMSLPDWKMHRDDCIDGGRTSSRPESCNFRIPGHQNRFGVDTGARTIPACLRPRRQQST